MSYTLETQRLVGRRIAQRKAPALTREQIAKLAPTIIVKRPQVVDESKERREQPTIFDLADLTPLARWQRGHCETLRKPLPGSGLVVSGEVSLPWRKYAQAAARNKVPPALRTRQVVNYYEHNIAPCEDHKLVSMGEQSLTLKELRELFLPEYKYIVHAPCLHRVSYRVEEDQYKWICKCGEWGFTDYGPSTLGRATGVAWYGCLKCAAPNWVPELSRRRFLQWGVGAGLSYTAWLRAFSPFTPIPYVPPAEGAPNTIFVDNNQGAAGNGLTGSPYNRLELARAGGAGNVVVGGNADVVKCRTATMLESFDTSHVFASGTTYANAATITKDTGNTPTIKMPVATGGFQHDSGHNYIIYDGLKFDCVNGDVFQGSAIIMAGASLATGSHHIRTQNCEGFSLKPDSGFWTTRIGHSQESISNIWRNSIGNGQGAGCHGNYIGSNDCLVQGQLCYGLAGLGMQAFDNNAQDAQGNNTHVFHRLITRRCTFRSADPTAGRRGGMLHDARGAIGGNDCLSYYIRMYEVLDTSTGCLNVRGVMQRANFFNFVIADNLTTGVRNGVTTDGGVPNLSKFRNIISVSNPANFIDNGTNTDQAGLTNSWQIGGFTAAFVNQAARDYHLQSISSGRGIGVAITGHTNSSIYDAAFREASIIDLDGVAVGSTIDAGVYQFGVASALSVLPASLAFSAFEGGANPATQALTIDDTANLGTMAWTVSDNAAWLSVAPASGVNDAVVTVSVNVAGLASGTYNANITVTAAGATGSPVVIPVTLVVSPFVAPAHGASGSFR